MVGTNTSLEGEPMKHKTMGVRRAGFAIKAAGEDDGLAAGTFTGYASVFGNVDSYGDIVEPGAFKDTLTAWEAKGDPIPLLWGHDLYDPFNNIGGITEAVEDDKGLLVTATIDLDNPTGAQVYRLIKGRRVTDMSFAYRVQAEHKAADGNHLTQLDVIEVSIVPVGANAETDILAVKSRLADLSVKAGRVLSAANEGRLKEATDKIQEATEVIESVLSSAATETSATVSTSKSGNPPDPADGKASDQPGDKSTPDEEPRDSAAKSDPVDEDRKSAPPVEAYAALFNFHALSGGE